MSPLLKPRPMETISAQLLAVELIKSLQSGCLEARVAILEAVEHGCPVRISCVGEVDGWINEGKFDLVLVALFVSLR
jgi:hypothetical protein